MEVLFFVLFTLITQCRFSQQFNPLKDPNICGRVACSPGNKFQYTPGIRQDYEYTVDISTLFLGTSNNKSTLHITGIVSLDFLTQCEGTLTFSDMTLVDKYESNEINEDDDDEPSSNMYASAEFSEAIRQYPIRFSFRDGVISEICPHENEMSWSLNFKRGVLSLFHNTMKRFDLNHKGIETDVHGTCPTTYDFIAVEGTSLFVKKEKDLSKCRERYKHHSILQTTPYEFKSNRPMMPIVSSSVECTLSIDHHIYNNIECKETHSFNPFSNENGAATTIIKQKLRLLDESTNYIDIFHQMPIEKRTNLLYDHEATPKPTSGELKASRELMKLMCQYSVDNMQREFSDAFNKFVHVSRQLSHTALYQLYTRTSIICRTAKKHLLDALPYLGSSAAVQLMTDIMSTDKNEIGEDLVNEWLLSFALIPNPSEDILSGLVNLLESDTKNLDVALSISAVCHTYCKNNKNCYNSIYVKRIVENIEIRILEAYQSRRDDRITIDMMLGSLKAIGNIGILHKNTTFLLEEMIFDEELDMAVRVASVEAFRRYNCEDIRDRFMDILMTFGIDSEIRIASYLQLMRCPNYITIKSLKYLLEMEQVNQVGSFVWSHLHNMLKSSNPSRVEIQGLLSDKDLGNKFRSDFRKFSHNFEGSMFFEEFNAGGNYESNVIFSTSSFVPRRLSLNFTLNLFGESVNLFEVDTRIENFEHYLEHYFGPRGVLNPVKYIQRNLANLPKFRFRRESKQNTEIGMLKSNIENIESHFNPNQKIEPKVSFALRVFGNDIKFIKLNGENEIKNVISSFNPMNLFKKLFSGRDIIYDRAGIFLDTKYIIPTGAGMPLTLNAVGTAALKLKMYGSLRGADFMKTKELDILGRIHPSVTVDMVGSMSVDSYYAKCEIKLKTNVYSATALEALVKVHIPQLVSIKFSLPNDKTEIFYIRSDIVVMNGEKEEYQKGITENRIEQSLCSWPAIDKTVGLKLCMDYQFPDVVRTINMPHFMLAGPSLLHMSLIKADPTAKVYLMEYKFNKRQNNSIISLVFDTPGSAVKRLLSVNLTIDTQSQNLTLFMETSAGATLAKGKYKNAPDEKYFIVGLDIDGKKHFDVQMILQRHESKYGHTYDPYFYLAVNNDRVAELNGTLKIAMKKGISQCDVDLNFKTKKLSTNLSGYFSKNDAALSSKLRMYYKFLNEPLETIDLEFKFSDRSTNSLSFIQFDTKILSSKYPQYNIKGSAKFQIATGHLDGLLLLNRGVELESPLHTLSAHFIFIYSNKNDEPKLNTYLEVKKPLNNLDWKLQFRYDKVGYTSHIMAIVRYAKDKNVIIQLQFMTTPTTLLHTEGKLNVTVPYFSPLILEGKIEEMITREFNIELKAVWFSGHRVYIRGRYQDRSTNMATNYFLKLLINSPSFPEINLNSLYFRDEQDFKIDIKAQQSNEEFILLIKHSVMSAYQRFGYFEVKYSGRTYSVTSLLDLKDYRQIVLDFHIDRWRDIHLGVRSLNLPEHRELGVEIKWNANRDPDQKLMVAIEFLRPESSRYTSKFEFSYPGRSINGIFDFRLRWYHYMALAKLSWGTNEFIEFHFNNDFNFGQEMSVTLKTELLTSIENWRKTSLIGGLYKLGNTLHTNGSVYWQRDKYILFDVYGDYNNTNNIFECEFKTAVKSTVNDISSISASLRHSHDNDHMDTVFYLTYHPDKVIELNSTWETLIEENYKQISGIMVLNSPFPGYQKGLLTSEMYFYLNNHILGLIDLDLDNKKYTLTVEGYINKVTDNNLSFNISTPVEKYKEMKGRFGFSEEKRHLVAEVKTPANLIGVELLFVLKNMSFFDIMFNLATPLDFMENALILGKLKNEETDFRLGWNKLQAGFSGIWFYENITNFEYSYKIYTPIYGYEENGFVTKLLMSKGLDMEASLQCAGSKVGLAVVGKSRLRQIKELLTRANYRKLDKNKNAYLKKMLDNYHEELEQGGTIDNFANRNLSWTGVITLDTIIYPTLKGALDIERRGSLLFVTAIVTLPDGTAKITNEWRNIGPLAINNKLKILTPYKNFKEINLNTTLDINHDFNDMNYNISFDLNYLNGTERMEMGFKSHYIQYIVDGPTDLELYNGSLHIYTPFQIIPMLDAQAVLEIEENYCNINLNFTSERTKVSLAGSGEIDEGIIEASIRYNVLSPFLNLPKTYFHIKKEISEVEHVFDMLLEMAPHHLNTKYSIKIFWNIKSMNLFDVEIKTILPVKPLENLNWKSSLDLVNPSKSANLYVFVTPNSFNVNSSLYGNILHLDIDVLLLGRRKNIGFKGSIMQSGDVRMISGLVNYDKLQFDANGSFRMHNGFPAQMTLELTPNTNDGNIIFQYYVQKQQAGYAVQMMMNKGNITLSKVEAHLSQKQIRHWNMHLEIATVFESFRNGKISALIKYPSANDVTFSLNASTPFREFQSNQINYRLLSNSTGGQLSFRHEIPNSKSIIAINWKSVLMEDMGIILTGIHKSNNYSRNVALEMFYVNKNRQFRNMKFGADISVDDNIWTFGTNLTLFLDSLANFDVTAHLKLPLPNLNTYSIICMSDTQTRYDKRYLSYLAKYYTQNKRYYSLAGNVSYSLQDEPYMKNHIDGNLQVKWGPTIYHSINNILFLKQTQEAFDISYNLVSPKFLDQDTIRSRISYQFDNPFHNITVKLFYPEKRKITNITLNYNGLSNMDGHINILTPFKDVGNAGATFYTKTQPNNSIRRFEPFWANSTALLNSTFQSDLIDKEVTKSFGIIFVEIPLATRHVTKVNYGYTERAFHNDGQATVLYNGAKVLDGKYVCDSETREGFNKDVIHIEAENKMYPIELNYIHQYEFDTFTNGNRFTTLDWKRIELFKLHNRTAFNVSSEVSLKTRKTGQKIKIAVSHANRTIIFTGKYDIVDNRFTQMSKLQLSPTVWASYYLNLTKNVINADSELQKIELDLLYPRRNFTFAAFYNVTNTTFSSDVSLLWDKAHRSRSVQACFDWIKVPDKDFHHLLEFQLKHPTFGKNVSLRGDFKSNKTRIFDSDLILEYSDDPSKTFHLSGNVDNLSNETNKLVKYNMSGSHPDTHLELLLDGNFTYNRINYLYSKLHNNVKYQRTFLPMEFGTIDAMINLQNSEVFYKKESRTISSLFHGKYIGNYPVYRANVTRVYGDEIDENGIFYLNIKDKLIKMDVNLSKDASHSFHIYGDVPDLRSVSFNVWTEYEDIYEPDLTYLLRLNHSRLIVSKFQWRPEIGNELKTSSRQAVENVIGNISNDIDYWKQYIRSEIHDAIKDVSDDAQPIIQSFIDDLRALKVLKDDIDYLIVYLNNSYNSNEFYVKDVVAFTMNLIDDMAIRNHIDSLPAIINEIWDVMGESGKVIQKSILWIVETIDKSYKKLTSLINELMKEDAMENLMKMMEQLLENYDELVKDLHVSVIKYIENLWEKLYETVLNQWNRLLQRIEPAFIELTHYAETIAYNMAREFLDFIYIRTHEIVESPYFNQFTNFTADIDKFYKDVTGSDMISVVYKYSNILIKFLRNKYFSFVPFGQELQNVINEIKTELKVLNKLPSVNYITTKWEEFYNNACWMYKYLDIDNHVRYVFNLFRSKIFSVPQTALQAENRYREAKTKFVYDPYEGIIYFEQKLPVSWHAFNETPELKEINEYSVVNKLQNYFENSNFTIRTLYYYYKSYVNFADWFPPFDVRAIIFGSQHLMTFDKKFVEFRGICTYLLAHDFIDNNFTVAVSYDLPGKGDSYILHLIVERNVMLNVNVNSNTVSFDNGTILVFPTMVDTTSIYMEGDALIVESPYGYKLKCNMKYDVCTLDTSGWYFGKTAGLWGTINNEPSDDLMTSTKKLTTQINRFAQSWSVGRTCTSVGNQGIVDNSNDENIIRLCDSMFNSKLSHFQGCFQNIDPNNFMEMCLKSKTEKDVCSMGTAYVEACIGDNAPVRMAEPCVKCAAPNGSLIVEDSIIDLNSADIIHSTDIVFIVEAKLCNRNIKSHRSIESLINMMEKELNDSGIANNRYSLIVFGGDGVFDEARSVVKNNNFFVSSREILSYFDSVQTGNGNSDIFNAINFALKLKFRPGASKTFIAFTCSNCDSSFMKQMDYSVLHELLHEHSVTLHIMMDQEFIFAKSRINKLFYGLDYEYAYTKKDGRAVKGDKELRKQVRIPKSVLGLCVPLALGTNGTVFTARKLEDNRGTAMKKFASVFAKRLAKTAAPQSCQKCVCKSSLNGVPGLRCTPCHYAAMPFATYYFNDEELPVVSDTDTYDLEDSQEE